MIGVPGEPFGGSFRDVQEYSRVLQYYIESGPLSERNSDSFLPSFRKWKSRFASLVLEPAIKIEKKEIHYLLEVPVDSMKGSICWMQSP